MVSSAVDQEILGFIGYEIPTIYPDSTFLYNKLSSYRNCLQTTGHIRWHYLNIYSYLPKEAINFSLLGSEINWSRSTTQTSTLFQIGWGMCWKNIQAQEEEKVKRRDRKKKFLISTPYKRIMMKAKKQGFGSGSVPGSALIWAAESGSAYKLRIRIRIQEGKNDPKKWKKGQNFHLLKCWMFSFEGWRLLL
jgi:hypothetical protein